MSSRNPRQMCAARLATTMFSRRPLLSVALLWAMIFSAGHSRAAADTGQSTDPAERQALYEVLAGINSGVDWATKLPDPCMSYQDGIYCLPDDAGLYHVTNLEFGFVSEYAVLVMCSENATLSPAISRLPYLQSLLIFNCFENGSVDATIPPEIGQLSASLQMLSLHRNAKLGGVLPAEMGNLTSLQRLVVTENGIGGSIPEELGGLRSLFQLDLSENQLSGSIPGTLNSLGSLLILDLGYNSLSGALPSLGGLTALQQMVLSNNELSGSIPEDYGSLGSLKYLDLSRNGLSGGLPASFANASQLVDLYLEGNGMGAPLPEFMGRMAGLSRVSLADSGFVGELPQSLGGLANLHVLQLQGNHFSGLIPPSLGDLPNIYQLDLSANNLSGPVPFSPAFLGKLGTNLQVFNNVGLCVPPESLRDGVGVLGVKICDKSGGGGLDATASPAPPGLGRAAPHSSAVPSRKMAGLPAVCFFALSFVLAHAL